MTTSTTAPAVTFSIEWDMGTYGPFATEAEARAFQVDKQMRGSSVVRSDDLAYEDHTTGVVGAPAGSRQPWRAECSCGWFSVSYARAHAAQIMADDHEAQHADD